MSFLLTESDTTKYALWRGKLCVGTVVIVGFVSTYFTVILLGFLFFVNVNWVFVCIAGFVIAGCQCK